MIKVNNKEVELNRFPDGTLNIKGNPELVDGDVVISWHYSDDSEFMAVAFLTKYYQAHANNVALYLPYVPNARMDRMEEAEDILAIKYFGDLINSLNFTNVFVLDVHSPSTMIAIKNCVELHPDDMFADVVNDILDETNNIPIIFFPDDGAMKRYSNGMKIPFAYGMKKRDWKSGKILGLEILGIDAKSIVGRDVLIRDDICSYGGTFYHAAKKLKEMGARNIYLMVTHCEPNIHNGKFGDGRENLLETGLIKRVYTTDSIYPFDTCDCGMMDVFKTKVTTPVNNDEDCDNCECECGCESCCENCGAEE